MKLKEMDTLRIIDSHQHFWKKELFADRTLPPEMSILGNDYEPKDLQPLLEKVGVQGTVLVQTHSSLSNTYQFLEYAETIDWIVAVVGWVDLTDPKVDEVLDVLQAHPKFKGVRHQWEDEADPAWILRDDVVRGLREVAKRGLRYDVLVKPPNWAYITQLAKIIPDLPLVIDHIGKPLIGARQFDNWAAVMTGAAEFPQMMCKISGMITEADWGNWKPADLKPYVHKVIEVFGVDRVMWGSDWPVCLLAGSYARVFDALQECLVDLTRAEKAMIMGENAKTFYGIANLS